MFSRLTIGETVGGASEAAITAMLEQGTLPQSRSDGKADLYAVMNRSDSDSGVEIDMVFGVVERRDGTSFLVGNYKGNPFEWKMED